MAATTDYPYINGTAFEGASVKIKLFGAYWRGMQGISYGDALEPNYVYELGSVAPIAMTRGQYKPEDISIEIIRERADAIRSAAGAQASKLRVGGYGIVPFAIYVHYDEPGNTAVTDVITGARIIKVANDPKVGAEALQEKWTVRSLSLSRNGLFLYK